MFCFYRAFGVGKMIQWVEERHLLGRPDHLKMDPQSPCKGRERTDTAELPSDLCVYTPPHTHNKASSTGNIAQC